MIFALSFSFSSAYHVLLPVRVPLYFSALPMFVCPFFFSCCLSPSSFHLPPFLHLYPWSCLLASLHVFLNWLIFFNPFFPFSQPTCIIISPPLPCLYFFSLSIHFVTVLRLPVSLWVCCVSAVSLFLLLGLAPHRSVVGWYIKAQS